MRDIRTDLRERLAAASARYSDEMSSFDEKMRRLHATHQETLAAVQSEMDAIRVMLAVEDRRAGEVATVREPTMKLPLADFLIEAIRVHGMMKKDALRAKAEEAGYLEEGNGRTLHFTLLNIVKAGRLRAWPDGIFDLPSHGPQYMTEEGAKMQTIM